MDPMKLLHRISELESANVDMQMEIESLVMQQQTCSPNAVVGTSLSRQKSRGVGSPSASGPQVAEVPSSVCKIGQLDLSSAMTPLPLSMPREGGLDMSMQTSFDLAGVHEWTLSLPRIDTAMQTSPCAASAHDSHALLGWNDEDTASAHDALDSPAKPAVTNSCDMACQANASETAHAAHTENEAGGEEGGKREGGYLLL